MPYLVITDFKAGMDRRRSIDAAAVGSLWELINAHITRGGEIEKRKAFTSTYSLPAGETFGLQETSSGLVVFGSAASPAVPVGVTYQRLQHPDGLAMADLLSSDLFDGKIYAIAEYSDGSVHHFYDGSRVTDWDDGVVRSAMTNNDGIATHLAALIDASASYSASAASNVITITGQSGTAFAISAEAVNVTGGTDDQTATVATTQTAVAGVTEVLATCSFQIVGGSVSAGVNKISNVKVNSVSIITSAIDWATSNAVTAANVATEINNTTSTPNYTATANGSVVTISAVAGTGTTPNGYALEVTAAGNVVVDNASFQITGGTASAGVNKVSSITINGVEILNTAVDWVTSNSATATAVAAQINTYSSSPDYIASASDYTVLIGKKVSTSTDSGLSMVVTTGGNVTTGSKVDWTATATSMAGGVASVAGREQISTVTIGGTFEAGDRFGVTLDSDTFGATGNPATKGTACRTHKSKMYTVGDNTMRFSAINSPTEHNINDVGAGFVNMSNHASGSENLTAIEVYQTNVAVFARKAIQIWYVDTDDDLNAQLQTLNNTGTSAPLSVVSIGDSDVFYYSDTGIRSLRARDSSNVAFAADIGTPIDDYVRDYALTLTSDQKAAACGVLEPLDGRYMLAIGTKVFVFSYFPGSKISAWSIYEPGFTISHWAAVDDRVYARSVDTIYLYGGSDNDTYDSSVVTVQLPFVSMDKPATSKQFVGVDTSGEGDWACTVLTDPDDLNKYINVGTLSDFNYDDSHVGAIGDTTHFAPKLVNSSSGYAKLSNMALHYTMTEQEVR